MNNIPDYTHFNRYYKPTYKCLPNACPPDRLNTLMYELFLDCYNKMRLEGIEMYVEILPELGREPFSDSFNVTSIISDAYYICVNLLFSPNIYKHIPEKYYEGEQDDNGWTQNLRDYYADAVVSMAYVILYSQSSLPSPAYRLMHFIRQRQSDDRYFFRKFKEMAEEQFNTIDESVDIDFLEHVELQQNFKINEMKITERSYRHDLLDNAGSKDQQLRILTIIKELGTCQNEKFQKMVDQKIEEVRNSPDFIKSIYFRDYFDQFYGIDSSGKPMPPSNSNTIDEIPDLDLPFTPPATQPASRDENTAEINTLKARVAELEKQLEDLDEQYTEQELKPEAFTSQQCCLFFYYIFDKLGLKYEYMNRSAWKRLIWRVANKSPKNIYDNLRFDFEDEQIKKDLVVVADAVRELFPEMASQIDNDKDA